MTRNLLVCALLAALVLAVFGRVVGAEFVAYDDDFYVTGNAVALGGVTADGLRWVLTHEHGGYWAPLTALSHMLDVELFGVDASGHHATSLVLHVLNTLLLFGFLAWTTRRTWPAALVAALFAVHPLHVEPVAWISSRKDLTSTLFAFAALWTHAAWVRRGGAWLWIATTLLFALGLAAKPMLVVLPFVLLCVDVWPLQRPGALTPGGFARLVAEKLPWLALGAVAIVATWFFLRESDSLFPFELSLADRASNAVVSYARYLGKTVWPSGLSAIYPHPNLPGSTPWSAVQVAGSAALLVVLGLAALATRHRATIVGWAWFVGTLLPVSGIVAFGLNAMADRFTYVPLVGLFLALAYGGDDLVRRLAERGVRWGRPATTALALVAVAACAVGSFARVAVWHDSVALFEDAVAKAPRSPIPRNNLGNALAERGLVDEAARQYRIAADSTPEHPAAWINLGNLALASGDAEEALRQYRKALTVDPDAEGAARNAAAVLCELGRPAEAVEIYRELVARDGERAGLLQVMASAQRQAGDRDGAAASYARALELDPEHARAHVGLGLALLERGETQRARELLERATELDATLPEAHAWLGVARERLGARAEALASFDAALGLARGWTLPLTHMAWLRATAPEPELRDPALALVLAERAVAGSGRADARALDALAAAQAANGDFASAAATVEEALAATADVVHADELRARLELYRAGRPFVAR